MFLTIVIAAFLLTTSTSFKIQPKIFNGFPAPDPERFPYYVYLEIPGPNSSLSCGGTIISNQWVLTAAHCLHRASVVDVYFGAWKLDEKHETMRVDGSDNLFVHPAYDPYNLKNDIALIKLVRPMRFNSLFQPVKLSQDCNTNEIDLDVIAIGNGIQTQNATRLAEVLQFAPLRITSSQECRKVFRSSLMNRRNVVCAESSSGSSMCKGDSGGPLVNQINGTLVGVFSFLHMDGCENGFPQVFTSVVHFYEFISSVTGINLPKC